MDSLTNAESALLGLLSEKPMYPYQIEKEVEERDMRFWTDLSMSSIYKLLRKLEEEDYVESTREISDENRLRKIYKITPTGINKLREQIRTYLSEPEHIKWQMDIAISNLKVLSNEEAMDCLRQQRTELKKKIEGYKDLEKYLKSAKCPAHRMALARRPIRIFEGEIRWIEEYIKELEEGGDQDGC